MPLREFPLVTSLTEIRWNNLFYVHAGIGAIPLVLGFFVIPRDIPGRLRAGEDRRIDWIGAFLATSGVTLLLFSLGQSQLVEKGFKEPCEFFLALQLLISRHWRSAWSFYRSHWMLPVLAASH